MTDYRSAQMSKEEAAKMAKRYLLARLKQLDEQERAISKERLEIKAALIKLGVKVRS